MLKIPDFTKPEIDYIKANANFTEREERLFDLKNSKEHPSIEKCAEIMDMSVSTVSRTTKSIKKKILKILQ